MPTKHARLSPSGANKWMGCPASLAAERGIPNTSSIHAAEGTAAHSVAENLLRALNPAWCKKRPKFSRLQASEYIGETVEDWLITDDMAPPIQSYVDTILAEANGKILHVEQRVDFSHVVGVRNSFGTADAVIIHGDEIQIHDLKFGRGVKVDAENNFQLMIYALGSLRLFELMGEFSTVKLFIHQPRLKHVSEWSISVQDLLKFGERVNKSARLAIKLFNDAENGKVIPLSKYAPSEKACRWCKAAPTCAAYARKVYETVANEFVDLDAAEFDCKDPGKLTPEQLVQAYYNADFIDAWVSKVKKECYARLVDGGALPGLKVVTGKPGNRKWSNVDEAENMLIRLAANDSIYTAPTLISPTAAEKLLKKNPEAWEEVQSLIVRPAGSPVVVSESDPRPAINGADEFSIVKGE